MSGSSGEINIMKHPAPACAMVMRKDFEYWELDELDLEPCCALKFYPNIEICNTQIEGDIQVGLLSSYTLYLPINLKYRGQTERGAGEKG